jgi:hypothetical protein
MRWRRHTQFDPLPPLPELPARLVSYWPPKPPPAPPDGPFDWEVECPEMYRLTECHVRLVEASHALSR